MMKRLYPILLLLLATPPAAHAQSDAAYDTIYVNDGTSYIIFNHKIYAFGLGNEKDFSAQTYENCLMIRNVTKRESTVSSVFASYGDSTYLQYYYAILTYRKNSFREFYDRRDNFNKYRISAIQRQQEKEQRTEEAEEFFISELKTRSDVIKKMPDEIYDYYVAGLKIMYEVPSLT